MISYEGGCLCGAVRYQGTEEKGGGHCYCRDCRRSSGTSHCSHMIVPEPAFHVSGELGFYESKADSGNTISRGFCPTCGSAVYSTNSGMPGLIFVRASSLDDPEVFRPGVVVYTSRAASWSTIDPTLPSFDKNPSAEEMAAILD